MFFIKGEKDRKRSSKNGKKWKLEQDTFIYPCIHIWDSQKVKMKYTDKGLCWGVTTLQIWFIEKLNIHEEK